MPQGLFVHDQITLQADLAKVWDALTNPEQTVKYMFGTALRSTWNVGDEVLWTAMVKDQEITIVRGNVLKVDPEKYLEYTVFDPNMGIEDKPSNYLVVTYELTSSDGTTTLTITQGDFAAVENTLARYDDTIKGWKHALQGIKEIVEG